MFDLPTSCRRTDVLAHESCVLTGEVLISGGGQVMRLALLESQGVRDEHMTPELVAENIDKVLDLTDRAR